MAKLKIRDYPCYNDIQTSISPEVKEELDLVFPDAYKEAESMARIAEYISEENGNPYATLPFCYTVEGEAMGGKVNYGDEHVGPRGAEPIVDSLEEVLALPDIDFNQGRIKEVLDAIGILKDKGKKVILKISGPISILNIIIDTRHVFVAMRRDKELLGKVYEKLGKNLINYIKEAIKRDVDVISYGDSAVAVDILGAKMMVQYLDDFLVDFLKEVEDLVGTDIPVHLCPKMTYALIDSGNAEFVEIEIDPSLTYAGSFDQAVGKETFVGSRCINNINSTMKSGKMKAIRLL